MRLAASCSAPVAVADRETTPAVMIATSGTRVTSPVAVTSSRVPAIVWVIEACCAAARPTRQRRPASGRPNSSHCNSPGNVHIQAQRSPERNGCFLNALESDPAAARDDPVDRENDEGADDRADEARALARLVPVEEMPKPSGKHRARDSEDDRDQAPARVLPGISNFAIPPAIPPMTIQPNPWPGSSNGISIRSPCVIVSFNRPSREMKQRALAKQVPLFVEKQWRRRDPRSVARGDLLI